MTAARGAPEPVPGLTHRGGLTMGGVTFVYFLDKWREDPLKPSEVSPHDHAR